MQKLSTSMLIIVGSFLVCMIMLPGTNATYGECLAKEKVTKIRFFIQDLVAGDNRTVWKVAQSDLTHVSPPFFGFVAVLDNLVTSGPEMDSGEVGRIQGIIGLADLREPALTLVLNLVFSNGEYKGSTLSISGRNPLLTDVREVQIVGGTGAFRMARGYAITRTHSLDPNRNGVYQYDAVVYHMG